MCEGMAGGPWSPDRDASCDAGAAGAKRQGAAALDFRAVPMLEACHFDPIENDVPDGPLSRLP